MSITTLICLTQGEARAAARRVYNETRYVCRIDKISTGVAVSLPGVPNDEAETLFTSIFAQDIADGYMRVGSCRCKMSVVATAAAV